MLIRVKRLWSQQTLARQFALTSLAILLLGMGAVGWWIGLQIEQGVIHRTAATTGAYVDSVLAEYVQELAWSDELSDESVATLNELLQETALGQEVAAFKIWDQQGRIRYSLEPGVIGQVFPVEGGLARAWQGEISGEISELEDAENILERQRGQRLLEIYHPVRAHGSGEIIAVAEFYHSVDDLERDLAIAKRQSWLVVGMVGLLMYLALARMVQHDSDVIAGQQRRLSASVTQLQALLGQNEELHDRVRRAAARTTAINERYLRRVSADLHDGPAQDLGLALLRLDHLAALAPAATGPLPQGEPSEQEATLIHSSLSHALQEIRAIASGLRLPELRYLSLAETLRRVVSTHERRTGTQVDLRLEALPEQASLPVKITLYRLVQEALHNAYRHADGVGQCVRATSSDGGITVEVRDAGPGFTTTQDNPGDNHLGLLGMRERVESLGGTFRIDSAPERGTRILAHLPLEAEETIYE